MPQTYQDQPVQALDAITKNRFFFFLVPKRQNMNFIFYFVATGVTGLGDMAKTERGKKLISQGEQPHFLAVILAHFQKHISDERHLVSEIGTSIPARWKSPASQTQQKPSEQNSRLLVHSFLIHGANHFPESTSPNNALYPQEQPSQVFVCGEPFYPTRIFWFSRPYWTFAGPATLWTARLESGK
ncbi:hypothetical protein ABW19_dt0203024 [Dactylella cylindrospora]|nr:hypothetical protein ABW19_dt0203024 [Dactylella cylindrospora]